MNVTASQGVSRSNIAAPQRGGAQGENMGEGKQGATCQHHKGNQGLNRKGNQESMPAPNHLSTNQGNCQLSELLMQLDYFNVSVGQCLAQAVAPRRKP